MIRKLEHQRRKPATRTTLEPNVSEQDLATAINLLNNHNQESTMASLTRYINEASALTGKLDKITLS